MKYKNVNENLSHEALISLYHETWAEDYSLPFYISDLIFSQILVCIMNIINKKLSPGIHSLSEDEEKYIAKLWLKQYLNYD